jgi:hypothetical protein
MYILEPIMNNIIEITDDFEIEDEPLNSTSEFQSRKIVNLM